MSLPDNHIQPVLCCRCEKKPSEFMVDNKYSFIRCECGNQAPARPSSKESIQIWNQLNTICFTLEDLETANDPELFEKLNIKIKEKEDHV